MVLWYVSSCIFHILPWSNSSSYMYMKRSSRNWWYLVPIFGISKINLFPNNNISKILKVKISTGDPNQYSKQAFGAIIILFIPTVAYKCSDSNLTDELQWGRINRQPYSQSWSFVVACVQVAVYHTSSQINHQWFVGHVASIVLQRPWQIW